MRAYSATRTVAIMKGGENMLKQYIIGGKQYQYKEGEQPEGAVELKKAVEPSKKAVEPANKARKPANKTRKAVRK